MRRTLAEMTNTSTPTTSFDYKESLHEHLSNETSPSNARYLLIIRSLSIYALVLVIVGTVGNLLTIVVLLRRNMRRFVTVRYLIIVSVCDTISLYGWNLNNFYKFNLNSQNDNIEEISLVHCRIISFMTFTGLQLSSWCLTAVSVDRALSLYWPHWKQSYGKRNHTKYYIAILSTICFALNSHLLFLNGYRTSTGKVLCYLTRNNSRYIYPQWERVHLVLYNLCPFALMCLCNTYIIAVTIRSSRAQKESKSTMIMRRRSVEKYRQLTALLILVTFAFVLLTLPSCVYFVFFRHQFLLKTTRTYRYMVQISLSSVQFTSHAINFFLYCFSATNFLHELQDMFYELAAICPRRRVSLSLDDIGLDGQLQHTEDKRSSSLEHHRTGDYARELKMIHQQQYPFVRPLKSKTNEDDSWP